MMDAAEGNTVTDSRHAYLCCHDDAPVCECELASGRLARSFATATGSEFVVAYR
jgi:hypothetical protein